MIHARPTLEIDLSAIAANYRDLCRIHGGPVHAVVKRDAYRLGLAAIGPLLAREGCREFFVEDLPEGRLLARTLEKAALPRARIHVLGGLGSHRPQDFARHGLLPVIGTRKDLERAASLPGLPVSLHLETGLHRLGLDAADLEVGAAALSRLKVAHVMTHLAQMAQPEAACNHDQHSEFLALAARFPQAGRSLGSSAFVFAGGPWQTCAARAGSAILGTRHVGNPAYRVRPAVRLTAPVLDVENHPAGRPIGYGRTVLARPSRLAVLMLGYADGLPEAFWAERASARILGSLCPILPEASMMQCFLDVTGLDEDRVKPGDRAEIFGHDPDINGFAEALGVKPNRILTLMGGLVTRRHVNPPPPPQGTP